MVPKITEIGHPLIVPLLEKSDRELLSLFQAHPNLGRYFVAIFCRYQQIIYVLTHDAARSRAQADYLFAQTWERIYRELNQKLRSQKIETINTSQNSLQNFLIDITGAVINSTDTEVIKDTAQDINNSDSDRMTPPLFLCYLNLALEELPPDLRLVLVLSHTFNWSSGRIAAYLQSEGDSVRDALSRYHVKDINELILEANLALVRLIPQDIQEIYLSPSVTS